MGDFGVKLQSYQSLRVGNGSYGGTVGTGQHDEVFRQGINTITMAHPDGQAQGCCPGGWFQVICLVGREGDALKNTQSSFVQGGTGLNLDGGRAILTLSQVMSDMTTQLLGQ